MAVPKKRTGKSAQAKRRANWKATTPATTTCKNCGAIVLTHTVCPECGTYKGKVASIKGQAMLETKEEEKEIKKSKKVKEEAPETKAEEAKAETETAEKPKRTRKTKKAETETEAKEEE